MTFSYSLSEIDKASDFIFNKIKSKTIFFRGDLGSGKTTLIKNLCFKIGTKETISSPTFPILNIYKYDEQSIYHADLYRINNLKDLNEIGFFDIINQKSWVFVEWPDIIINMIDSPYSIVKISNEGKQKRKLLIKNS
tara:strand:- start:677 stop:1087 length:411 start_codon:yes stop_codon:yes gene_type:complete